MKGNKKVLALALLLLLVAVSFGTYAIYQTTGSSSTEVSSAAWVIEVNGDEITDETAEFDLSTITWNCPTSNNEEHVEDEKIAPGCTGTTSIVIDASDAEVSVDYAVSIGSVTIDNVAVSGITVSSSSSLTGSILLSANPRTATIPLTITWNGAADDGEQKNAADTGMAGETIQIEIEVDTHQKLS